MIKTLLVILAFLFPTLALAQVSPVQDSVGLLSTKEVSQLSQYLVKFEKHIVIVIKYSNDIEQDALNFGRGPNGADIVIWLSPKHDDQPTKVRVEIGTRLEGKLTDGTAGNLTRDFVPLLKEKKYYEFLYNLSSSIHKVLEDQKKASADKDPSDELVDLLVAHPWVLLLLIVAWIILFLVCPDCALFFLYIILSSKSSSSSSYSSSSGDFSGGGSTVDD